MADYSVLVVCAGGMSSSLMENRTREAAQARGHRLTIHALSLMEIAGYDFKQAPIDMVLIAPQVRFKKKNITQIAEPYGIVVQDIEPVTFGMVDGEKIFEQIVKAIVKE